MVRQVVAHNRIKHYLEKCAEESKFSLGLIIGQASTIKNYIVQLAKNSDIYEKEVENTNAEPSELVQPRPSELLGSSSSQSTHNINHTLVCNHLINVTKMIPGSFFVLGIFIVDENDLFGDDVAVKKLKQLLPEMTNVLKHNKYLCGSFCGVPPGEKLVLSYSSITKKIICKLFDTKDGNGYFMPTDFKFNEKILDWYMFETNYELDEVYPIVEKQNKFSIEYHFALALDSMANCLTISEMFIQNEPVDHTQVLENYIKQKTTNKQESKKSFQVFIYLPAVASNNNPIVVEKYDGLIRLSGIISSRTWVHSKNTFEEIVSYIRCDILRSLSSRIQIYCDGLIDPNVSYEAIMVSEPPRRVYFEVPNCDGIQFSEYIFRGETPSIAAAQAKDILDIDIDIETICSDLEGLADEETLSLNTLVSQTVSPVKSKRIGQYMYMAVLLTAILVLVISIILHFMLR